MGVEISMEDFSKSAKELDVYLVNKNFDLKSQENKLVFIFYLLFLFQIYLFNNDWKLVADTNVFRHQQIITFLTLITCFLEVYSNICNCKMSF